MTTMGIYLHGGKCCGIKHIFGLDYSPADVEYAKDATPPGEGPPNEAQSYHNSPLNFFLEAAPKESKGDRFTRYVDYIKKVRPSGIIEVVLSQFQTWDWGPFITNLGFVKLSEGFNSNSSKTIHIYHLSYLAAPVAPKEKPLRQTLAAAA